MANKQKRRKKKENALLSAANNIRIMVSSQIVCVSVCGIVGLQVIKYFTLCLPKCGPSINSDNDRNKANGNDRNQLN